MKFGIKKRDDTYQPDIDIFRKSISDLFDDFFSVRHGSMYASDYLPAIDVREDNKGIYIKADIPGIDEKDLSVNIEKNVLMIKGEKNEERREEKDKKVIIMERKYGAFQRSIKLPEGINSDQIRASFKNGVLSIDIPKEKVEEPKKVKISVR